MYYYPRYYGYQGLLRLREDLHEAVDLIVAVPQVSVKKLLVLKWALGAKYTAGEGFLPYRGLVSFPARMGWRKSILETQEEITAALGIAGRLKAPSIKLTPEEMRWAEATARAAGLVEPVVGVHCAANDISACGVGPTAQDRPSGGAGKEWPAERFGSVIRSLRMEFPGLCIVSVGTAGERAKAEKARRVAGNGVWLEGTGVWTVRQSLAMLQRCQLVLSGDTGIMHMAAAVGTRTASVFGPTSTERLAPTYNGGIAVYPDTTCHPCNRNRPIRCDCILTIDAERVVAVVAKCLREWRTGSGRAKLGAGQGGACGYCW